MLRDVTKRALVSAQAGAEVSATFVSPHEGGAWLEGDAEAMVPAALGLGIQALVGRWVVLAHVAGAPTRCVPVDFLNSVAEELIGVVPVAVRGSDEKPEKINLGLTEMMEKERERIRQAGEKSRGGKRVLLSDTPTEHEFT